MKNLIFKSLAILTIFAMASCDKDEPIPVGDEWIDPAFARALLREGLIADAETVTPFDVVDIEEVIVHGDDVNSLRGIGYFKSLKVLECSGLPLGSIDVSNNHQLVDLLCSDCGLTALDVSKNTKLEWLSCSGNYLTSLNVSNNSNLYHLGCEVNELTRIDLPDGIYLNTLRCSFNQLSSLDLSGCPNLEYLYCDSNFLTCLDFINNPRLKRLDCVFNRLESLDLSNTQIEALNCFYNPGKDGKFVVTLGANSNIPSFGLSLSGWGYDHNYVTLEYQKK